MKIKATLHMMAESEIMAMIPEDRLKTIKAKDPHPTFKAYVVGHEGEAKGNLVGVGNIVKRWFGDMVRKLNEKIKTGLQLFHGHAATNDTSGRVAIGEVVGKRIMDVYGRLSSVVACWIYPDYRHLPLDVASIEADIDMDYEPGGNLLVTNVNEITGIALGNSQVETPGFPGATLLGQLQAFVEKKHKLQITLFEGENTMTLEELKKAIKEAKLKASDVFERDEIMADPLVSEQVKEKISNARGYDIRKTESLIEEKAALQKQLDEAGKKIKEHEESIKTLKVETSKSKVGDLFEAQKKERKLNEQQEKYLKNRLPNFKPQDPEKLKDEFNSWLDGGIEDYKKDAEALGIKLEPDNGKPASKGAEPDTKAAPLPEEKYLDPAQNPFIKTD
jgi:hypothetical protein